MIYAPSIRHRETPDPSHALIFVASGDLSRQTLAELPRVAEHLRVRAVGRFGFVEASASGIVARHAKIIGVPPPDESAASAEQTEHTEHTDSPTESQTATSALSTRGLVRRLNLLADRARVMPLDDARCDIYLLIDLTSLADVRRGLDVLAEILTETNHLDVTALLFTGRSAASDQPTEDAWKQGLREVFQACDDRVRNLPVHRLYLVDGMNSRRSWLPGNPEVARIAAEFLMHHGLGCERETLRATERSRVSRKLPIEQFVGSFCCRTMSSDLELIAEEVADRLIADSHLDQSDPSPPTSGERDQAGAIAMRLDAKLDCALGLEAGSSVPEELRELFLDQIGDALAEAARESPVRNLQALLPELERLTENYRLKVQLLERRREREHAARELKRQVESEPVHTEGGAAVRSPQSCQPKEYEWLVKPVSKMRRSVGTALILAGGLVASLAGVGGIAPSMADVATPAVCLIAGAVLMSTGILALDAFRKPWTRRRIGRTYVGRAGTDVESVERKLFPRIAEASEDQTGAQSFTAPAEEPAESPPVHTTRAPRSAGVVFLGLLMAAVGAILVGHSFEPLLLAGLNLQEVWIVAGVALTALIACLWHVGDRAGRELNPPANNPEPADGDVAADRDDADDADEGGHRRETDEPKHFSGTDHALAYYPRTFGLWRALWLVVLVGCLTYVTTQWPLAVRWTDYPWSWDMLPGALYAAEYAPYWLGAAAALLAMGLLIAAWPCVGKRKIGRFDDVVRQKRQDRVWVDIEGPPRISGDLDACLTELQDWLKRMLIAPATENSSDTLVWPEPFPGETFLDAVADDWPRRLADRAADYVRRAWNSPREWADLILERLREGESIPGVFGHNLAEGFVLRAARSWLANQIAAVGWEGILSDMNPDRDWLGRFFERQLSPQWPVSDRHLLLDSGLALVDADLAGAAAGHVLHGHQRWRVRAITWPGEKSAWRRVTLLRLVQGIPEPFMHDLLFNETETTT